MHCKRHYGFALIELLAVLAIALILMLLASNGYSYLMQRSYTNAAIDTMRLDADFMDKWASQHGSFISNIDGKLTWPQLPYSQYRHDKKIVYEIYLSPVQSPQYAHYHIIAKPTLESGLKGNGCICIDDSHNILTGMSQDCNNSNQKC